LSRYDAGCVEILIRGGNKSVSDKVSYLVEE
jgi:hypothetical protein